MNEKEINAPSFFNDQANKDKRKKQIKGFYEYLSSIRTTELDQSKNQLFTIFDFISNPNDTQLLEEQFNEYLLSLEYPVLDLDDKLVEVLIRYSIVYMEEFDYDLKLAGLGLIEHLLLNLTSSKLVVNMRSSLIYETLSKYLNDKESIAFLDRIIRVMCILLGKFETKYAASEHCFSKHSIVVDSLLNNCYMSSNFKVKTVYLVNLKLFLAQMNDYSCRHFEKYLTVSFDFVESVKILSFDEPALNDLNNTKQEFVQASIDLVYYLVETCSLRVHAHARRIVSFCIKILYLCSLNISEEVNANPNENYCATVAKVRHLIAKLFQVEEVRETLYDEFKTLLTNKPDLNNTFLRYLRDL